MRYLLDTGIIRQFTASAPPPSLVAWMSEQADEDLFVSALTIAELRWSVVSLPRGRQRDVLHAWFVGPQGPPALFAGRVLPFDEKAGFVWSRLMAAGEAEGRTRRALNTIIAAIAECHGCVVVTEDETGFEGVETLNPLRARGRRRRARQRTGRGSPR